MNFFNITISGLDTLDADLDKEIKEITSLLPNALNLVGSEMVANLQKHINKDVYTKYKPRVYQRRSKNPQLGTPLVSSKNMDYSVENNTLTFNYTPTGKHQNSRWNTAKGDELINRIQLSQGWTYEFSKTTPPPPRPFWNDFLRDQEQNGIMKSLAKGLKPYKVIKDSDEMTVLLENSKL